MKRYGLFICTGQSSASAHRQAPLADLEEFHKLSLDDPSRGGFHTEFLVNKSATEIRRAIGTLLCSASPDDFALVYYSGHGIFDDTHRLFLATTALPAPSDSAYLGLADIIGIVAETSIERLLIVLDCGYGDTTCNQPNLGGQCVSTPNLSLSLCGFTDVSEEVLAQVTTQSGTDGTRDRDNTGVYLMTWRSLREPSPLDTVGRDPSFTQYLTEGMRSEALVTLPEAPRGARQILTVRSLYRYLRERTPRTGTETLLFAKGACRHDLIIAELGLAGDHEPLGFRLSNDHLQLSNLGPTYILDPDFRFLDWNAAFEYTIAMPLRLRRGMHVETFLVHLDNWENEVRTRSMREFVPGNYPRTDTERLTFTSPRFGHMVFEKLASRLSDSDNWCVTLNVSYVQRPQQFWQELQGVIIKESMWSSYAESYDAIISACAEYQKLLDQVIARVGLARTCLDVGAGTGNAAIKLLQTSRTRRVHAIDMNQAMLRRLDAKLTKMPELRQRVEITNADCISALGAVKEEGTSVIKSETYDACVMLNVLFAMDDPVSCLKEIHRVVRQDGVFVLSTSRSTTNVDQLFATIEKELRESKTWEAKKALFDSAYKHNKEMEPMIVRYTAEDIEGFMREAGFVEDRSARVSNAYVDCVLIVRAAKRKT